MFGIAGIAGNAFGFTAPPSPAQQAAACRPFHRDGTDDMHVVQADTLVFSGRPGTEVILVPGPGHCAAAKLPQMIPTMIGWLRAQLATS